jgi:hypothetical protein
LIVHDATDFASDPDATDACRGRRTIAVGLPVDAFGEANERRGFNRLFGLFVNALVTNPI